MRRLILVLSVILSLQACAGGESAASLIPDSGKYNPATHMMTADNRNYKVYYPSQPVSRVVEEQETHTGRSLNMINTSNFHRSVQAESIGNSIYAIEWTGKDLKLTSSSRMERSAEYAENINRATVILGDNSSYFLSKFAMSESSRTPFTTLQGDRGVDIEGKAAGGGVCRMKVIIDRRGWADMLLAEGKDSEVHGKEAEQFFSSFLILQRL